MRSPRVRITGVGPDASPQKVDKLRWISVACVGFATIADGRFRCGACCRSASRKLHKESLIPAIPLQRLMIKPREMKA